MRISPQVRYSRAVPREAVQELLLGALCAVERECTALHFSTFEGEPQVRRRARGP